ncbi:D-glycerate dehydrogenase [Amylibacter sp.]|jgi:lactate dehydrogenase-like 2-hydroxyacid dehydrogenase|nr:D-glycerate dehydrogenase [Rhodobacterales bacterium]MDA8645696.1 D-glycerate dehydrogenase [Amylibacter sp.]MBT4322637.1 D-glycerate dehydrogenase [Rhodobacterales bacterium]MBT6007660.1 D-glycerate dehydrogenase [Rhodobacterales bacterium]MDA9911596.1 D-glycerate dehydrogenase [Amylibacter sp.]
MTKPKILVSRRWPEAVETAMVKKYDVTFNIKDKPLSTNEFKDALSIYDAILPTVTDKISSEVFKVKNPRTKIFGNYGVGFSHIDIPAAKAAGITVSNTPDVLSDCTADITLTLMLMAARRAGEGEREVRSGNWEGWRPRHLIGTRITGKSLGIIGFGRIGREVAKRAHFGFGMKIVVQNRSKIGNDILIRTNAHQVDNLDELLETSDFISLHCPGGDDNHHLISTKQFKKMKNSAILINTARGEVVDDNALILALKSKEISAVGLDVFNNEPNINPELMKFENAILLPHLGSATQETREAMGFRVLDNIADFFEGKVPRDKVA